MGFRRSTLLVLAAAVLGFGILGVLWSRRPAETGPLRLLPSGADVVSLELDFGRVVRLERVERRATGDDWRIVLPEARPADPGVVDAMIASLDLARPVRAVPIDPRTPDARFGLRPSRGRVTIGLAAGRSVVVEFGTQVGEERRVYVRTSLRPDRALVLDDSVMRSVAREPAALRDRRLWVVDTERIAKVEIDDGERSVRLERSGAGFVVTPPGVLADVARSSRLLDLLATPRATGFPAAASCTGEVGLRIAVTAAGGVRLGATAEEEVRHELAFAAEGTPCPDCPEGSVAACAGDAGGVAVPEDLPETARAFFADLARAPLFGAFDPAAVVGIAVTSGGETWTLQRTANGWDDDVGSANVEPAATERYLRALALLVVDPARTASEPFAVAGTIELRLRGGGTSRVERSAAEADGSVPVRRAGEKVAFLLGPTEGYLVSAPRVHLLRATGASCDPLAVQSVEVQERLEAGGWRLVQGLQRADGERWVFVGSDVPADAAATDLLVGDLCRLKVQPLVPAVGDGRTRWSATLRDAAGGVLLRCEVGGAVASGGYATAVAGEGDLRIMPDSTVERLRRPLAAGQALQVPVGAGLVVEIERAGAVPLRLESTADGWTSPGLAAPLASAIGLALASPSGVRAVSLDVATDPSASWPRRYRVTRRTAAGDVSTLVVGGPDAEGRELAWAEGLHALFEIDPSVVGDLLLLEDLVTR